MANWQHSNRVDLSSWFIHFVHERDPRTSYSAYLEECADLIELEGQYYDRNQIQFPDYYSGKDRQEYIYDALIDEYWPLPTEASAFEVLQKIIHDGFIRSGWSFRNGNPTIYGPYSAICFTEMPLYALIEYANKRQSGQGFVGKYGIAFKKNELFEAGARNVIYGLSTVREEASSGDPFYGWGMRTLAASCGLGINEQYRYVYTNLSSAKPVDWTFEREWRLPITDKRWTVPGLPFLLDREEYNNPIHEAFIIVETNEEKDIILDMLVNMFHSKRTNVGYDYDLEMIKKVGVVSIEQLSKEESFANIKIDDIDISKHNKLTLKTVSQDTLDKIDKAINNARSVYDSKYPELLPDYGGVAYSYPISHLKICTDDYTEVTQGMIDKGIADTFAEGKYYIDFGRAFTGNQYFGYAVYDKVAKELSDCLGQYFFSEAIPD